MVGSEAGRRGPLSGRGLAAVSGLGRADHLDESGDGLPGVVLERLRPAHRDLGAVRVSKRRLTRRGPDARGGEATAGRLLTAGARDRRIGGGARRDVDCGRGDCQVEPTGVSLVALRSLGSGNAAVALLSLLVEGERLLAVVALLVLGLVDYAQVAAGLAEAAVDPAAAGGDSAAGDADPGRTGPAPRPARRRAGAEIG